MNNKTDRFQKSANSQYNFKLFLIHPVIAQYCKLNPKKFFPIRTVLLFTVLLPFAVLDSFGKDQKIAHSMTETAQELISSLGPKKTAELVYKFENSSREHWHFFPNWSGRKGIPLSQFSKKQKVIIKELLNLLLTSEAFQEQENIRLIHGLRKDLSDPNNPINLYYLSIFGTPSTNTNWGWRFEGHHLSLNCTLVDGKLFSVTPSFWGSSPVRANDRYDHKIEVFEDEQKLSLSFVESLTEGQKIKAELNRTNGPRATPIVSQEDFQNDQGLPFSELNSTQQELLRRLIFAFAKKYRPEIFEQVDQRKPIIDTSSIRFSYRPTSKPYISFFRILSNEYLIEYDNQGGNHIHAVWRDFDGDFGRDLIKQHLTKEIHR